MSESPRKNVEGKAALFGRVFETSDEPGMSLDEVQAYVDGTLSAEERALCDDILRHSPSLRAAVDDLAAFRANTDWETIELPSKATSTNVVGAKPERRGWAMAMPWVLTGACAATLAVVSLQALKLNSSLSQLQAQGVTMSGSGGNGKTSTLGTLDATEVQNELRGRIHDSALPYRASLDASAPRLVFPVGESALRPTLKFAWRPGSNFTSGVLKVWGPDGTLAFNEPVTDLIDSVDLSTLGKDLPAGTYRWSITRSDAEDNTAAWATFRLLPGAIRTALHQMSDTNQRALWLAWLGAYSEARESLTEANVGSIRVELDRLIQDSK